MKMKKILSVAAIAVMLFSSGQLMAQSRVSIVGNAVMVSKDNASWALEVGGKVVTGYDYAHFKSTDGVYFAVEAKNGKWGICDNTGAFLFQCTYAKTTVSGATAVLYETADGTPKFYDCAAKKYVEAEQVSADFFDKDREFDPTRMTQAKASEQAKMLSAQVAPHGKFEIRQKANSNRQELVVDGKVVWECQEFRILSSAEDFNRTTCWAFIVKDKGYYGTFVVSLYLKDGKKQLESQQFIPYEYTFIKQDEQPGIVRCTKKGGVIEYRAWTGQMVE